VAANTGAKQFEKILLTELWKAIELHQAEKSSAWLKAERLASGSVSRHIGGRVSVMGEQTILQAQSGLKKAHGENRDPPCA